MASSACSDSGAAVYNWKHEEIASLLNRNEVPGRLPKCKVECPLLLMIAKLAQIKCRLKDAAHDRIDVESLPELN